jgi:adenosylhomocysteine nucleosidase
MNIGKDLRKMNKIGIIGAMDIEVSELISKMEVKNEVEKAGMKFYEGALNGKGAVIVKCGIGKVNAAMCVQILSDVFNVDAVINTGVAGSLRAEINIGDIVVSTDACEHDMDVRALGYEPGIIPDMAESFFKADRKLVENSIAVCKEVNPDINVYEGRVLSGDQFISAGDVKDRLIATFNGSCTEMEGAAIAHAAYLNNIPYVVIRAISDKADGSAHMDYPEFEKAAAAHSAKLVENLVVRL